MLFTASNTEQRTADGEQRVGRGNEYDHAADPAGVARLLAQVDPENAREPKRPDEIEGKDDASGILQRHPNADAIQ